MKTEQQKRFNFYKEILHCSNFSKELIDFYWDIFMKRFENAKSFYKTYHEDDDKKYIIYYVDHIVYNGQTLFEILSNMHSLAEQHFNKSIDDHVLLRFMFSIFMEITELNLNGEIYEFTDDDVNYDN